MTERVHDLDPATVNVSIIGRGHPRHPEYVPRMADETEGHFESETIGETTVSRRLIGVLQTAGDTL